ncbi:unnamed protein product, partial [Scytosiphon promiscuus]
RNSNSKAPSATHEHPEEPPSARETRTEQGKVDCTCKTTFEVDERGATHVQQDLPATTQRAWPTSSPCFRERSGTTGLLVATASPDGKKLRADRCAIPPGSWCGHGPGEQQQQQQQQQRDDLRVDRSGLGGVAAGAATFVPPPGFQGGYYPYPGFAPMYPHPATMDQKSAAGVSLDPERVAAINRALALAQVKPVSGPAPGGAGAAVGSSLGQLHQLTSGAAAGPIDSASWASLH